MPCSIARPASAIALAVYCATLPAAERFEHVSVTLERNMADQDTEIKFEATSSSQGLASLKVVSPDGRTVIDFKSPQSKLGLRTLSFESPEPPEGQVQSDFPAGTYAFTASTPRGEQLKAQATLSHTMPPAARLIHPQPKATNVPISGLQIKWQSEPGLEACIVVIEHEASGRALRSNLRGDASTLAVPDGFLQAGTAYKLAIGTVAKGGNASFIETDFTTARK